MHANLAGSQREGQSCIFTTGHGWVLKVEEYRRSIYPSPIFFNL